MTFPVTNNHDTGDGSLRNAILLVNASPGPDKIAFTLDSAQQTIQPLSALAAVTDPVTIDGTTQPGWAGNWFIYPFSRKTVVTDLEPDEYSIEWH
jgi:hypothetical protein